VFTFLGGLCLAVLGIGLLFHMNKKSATKEAKNHSVMLKILFSSLQVVHTHPNPHSAHTYNGTTHCNLYSSTP
jgi:hypothetical protein